MRLSGLFMPALLLASVMAPVGAHAAGLRHAATQADRDLLNHAYYCETRQALEALEAGANIDVVTSGGFTALMTAALNDCDQLAAELIARGARLDPENDAGQTALDIARINSPNVADRLEAAGGDGDAGAPPPESAANAMQPARPAPRKAAKSPAPRLRHPATQADLDFLNHAYYCETRQALEALEAGANIDVVTSGGFTALMTAALNDCDQLAAELIARGARLDPENEAGQTALEIARINSPNVADRLEAAGGGAPAIAQPRVPDLHGMAAPQPAATAHAEQANAQAPGGAADWPPLGYYKPGQQVLHGCCGVYWTQGVVKRVMPDYGYVVDTDVPYRSGVAGVTREPFWTAWFFGDWNVEVPAAYTAAVKGNMLVETVTAGMDLPPLHIDPDGSYAWRVGVIGNEQLVEGRWEPNPDAPGVILKGGEFGADWLVGNITDNTDEHERITLYTPKHTGYQGQRVE